jgi:hypothetical protein
VIFSVTPHDRQVALTKISEALGIYLSLPQSPIQAEALTVQERKLASNVEHLNQQLALVKGMLALQGTRMNDQERVINAQEYALNLSAASPPQERVELMGGIVALTKFEVKGVEISWAKVFQRVQEIFRKHKRT